MSIPSPIPYCGLPPVPAELAGRWNLDPVLIGTLLALLGLYLFSARRAGILRPRVVSFCAGWLIVLIALTSPLCALSVALFSARIGQHMVLTLLAAPLVALGLPVARSRSPMGAAIAFLALLWFWHAPAPYAATFGSPRIYWVMHVTMIGSAIWLWAQLLDGPPSAARLGAAAVSMMQMGFLGALLTLAPRALYGPHQLTTAAWGLTPLQDQQLGGALMWAPGGLVFLAAALVIGRRWMAPAPVLRPAE
jgi:putative membrane protein